MYIHHKKFYWNPSMRKEGHFYYWICNLMQKSPFLWSKKKFPKKALRMEDFQSNFFETTFHQHFLDENIIFRSIFHFDRAYQSWISDVLGVKNNLLCSPLKNKLKIFVITIHRFRIQVIDKTGFMLFFSSFFNSPKSQVKF